MFKKKKNNVSVDNMEIKVDVNTIVKLNGVFATPGGTRVSYVSLDGKIEFEPLLVLSGKFLDGQNSIKEVMKFYNAKKFKIYFQKALEGEYDVRSCNR